MADTLRNLFICTVCKGQLDNSNKMLPCQHTFCKPCLQNILHASQKLQCPECKFLVKTQIDDLPPNIMILKLYESRLKPTDRKSNQCEIEVPQVKSQIALERPQNNNNNIKSKGTPDFSKNPVTVTQSNKGSMFNRANSLVETFEQLKTNEENTNSSNGGRNSGKLFCWQCKERQSGEAYYPKNDQVYCKKCYEHLFADRCTKCEQAIGIHVKSVLFKEQLYHETCFICEKCKKRPVGGVCQRNEDFYCKNCYEDVFSKTCSFCTNIIKCGEKYLELNDDVIHSLCFRCYSCKKPIEEKTFFEKDDRIYCKECHDEKFRSWCSKCKKVIDNIYISYDNETWCDICFVCSACKASLSDGKKKCYPKNDELFCLDCYCQYFAHKCESCQEACGVQGKASYSIGNFHWHEKCFVCVSCKDTLVGHGAIPSGKDIFCSGCYWSKPT